ncbi:hypothetical protein PXY30_004446 [Salmonella enterica]|nr:hypothetical protein [Salmonella enterica]
MNIDTNWKLVADIAKGNGTKIDTFQDEVCSKCGSIYYYHREGRRRGNCLGCTYINNNNSPSTHLDKQVSLTPVTASEIDENGIKIYEGRTCAKCGSNIRIGERAYGAKNIGACRSCAIHQQQEKQFGKEIKRQETTVKKKTSNFIIQSIVRSGTEQIAPSSMFEYFNVRDLMWRCEFQNLQEKSLDTKIRWELGHMFPASGGGTEYRGKSTTDNLYLVRWEKNRKDGDTIPDVWEKKQVIKFSDCQQIINLHDAAKMWRKRMGFELTPQQKKEITVKERTLQSEYQKRVRELTQGALDCLPVLENGYLFDDYYQRIKHEWNKIILRMNKQIDAYKDEEDSKQWAKVRDFRYTIDAFNGAYTRELIVVQTFEQILDAEIVLTEKGITEQESQMIDTIKRCAVMWARDILSSPKNLVMGFTHPLIDVLKGSLVWGTYLDEHTSNQWLCVWKGKATENNLTPFENGDEAIRRFSIIEKWKEGDENLIYWTLTERREAEAREKAKAKVEAKRKADKEAAEKEVRRHYEKLLETIPSGFDWLYDFADTYLSEYIKPDAYALIKKQQDKAADIEQQLRKIGNQEYETPNHFKEALTVWQISNSCYMRHMWEPKTIFFDLLNPF